MSALTLAIDNRTPGKARTASPASAGQTPWKVDTAASPDGTTERSIDKGDIVLTLLWHARSVIERIAERRRAGNLVRNRVETRRQLARLPTWVRNDLLPAEQRPVTAFDRTSSAGEINHDV